MIKYFFTRLLILIALGVSKNIILAQDIKMIVQSAHLNGISVIESSPDDNFIATGGDDAKLKIINKRNKLLYADFYLDYPVEAVCFSNNGKFVAACTDKHAFVWELSSTTRKNVFKLPKKLKPNHILFNQEDKYLLIKGKKTLIFDIEKNKEVFTSKGILQYNVKSYYIPKTNLVVIESGKKRRNWCFAHNIKIYDFKKNKKLFSQLGGWVKSTIYKDSLLVINYSSKPWLIKPQKDLRDPVYHNQRKHFSEIVILDLKRMKFYNKFKLKENETFKEIDYVNPSNHYAGVSFYDDTRYLDIAPNVLNNEIVAINEAKLLTLNIKNGKKSILKVKKRNLPELKVKNDQKSIYIKSRQQNASVIEEYSLTDYSQLANMKMDSIRDLNPYKKRYSFNKKGNYLYWRMSKNIAVYDIVNYNPIEEIQFISNKTFSYVGLTKENNVTTLGKKEYWNNFKKKKKSYFSQWESKSLKKKSLKNSKKSQKNNGLKRDDLFGFSNYTLKKIKTDSKINLPDKNVSIKFVEEKALFSKLLFFMIFIPPIQKYKVILRNNKRITKYRLSNTHPRRFAISENLDKIAFTPMNKLHIADLNIKKRIASIKLKKKKLLVINPDFSKTLIINEDKKTIEVWDLAQGKIIKKLKSNLFIKDASFTSDNKYVFSLSVDGLTTFWDIEKEKPLLYFLVNEKGDDIIFTDENYYMISKNNLKSIGFRAKGDVFPYDQYDVKFNRPDKVLEKWPYADKSLIPLYRRAYEKRLKKTGFNEKMFNDDWHVPKTLIANKEKIESISYSDSLEVEVFANDTKYNLNRVNIWVNDIPVFGIKGYDLSNLNQKEFVKKFNIKLSKGANKIQVSSFNQIGAESNKETIYTRYTPDDSTKSNLYIVTIGVSEYLESENNLKYATKDGKDIIRFFKSDSGKIWKNIFVDSLFNENVTIGKIRNLKQKLLKSQVDDQVILFVSGHGLLDDNFDFYFASHNMDFNAPSRNGVPYELLEDILDSIPARKKLMLIDACHSGEADKDNLKITNNELILADGTKAKVSSSEPGHKGGISRVSKKRKKAGLQNSFELMQQLYADVSRSSGSVVLSAAAGEGYALESAEWNNGAFTYSLLSGLKTGLADINENSQINITELKEYVMNKVVEITNGRQKPTVRNDNLEFDFRIW